MPLRLARRAHPGSADDPRSERSGLLAHFLNRHVWEGFDLVGFSLISESQLPFAMLIARLLRERRDGLRVVAGGAYVTEMIDTLAAGDGIFRYFDFLVCHEGESALLQIADGKGGHVDHPNVVQRGWKTFAGSFLVEDIEALPEQDFSQFNMSSYEARGKSLPIYSSKGCSWGRCAFCSINFLRHRERDPRTFFEMARRAPDWREKHPTR